MLLREPVCSIWIGPVVAQMVLLDMLYLDRSAATPLSRQLYLLLRDLIAARQLAAGGSLPSSRMLARDLRIGRNTVVAAYDQLATEGYIKSRRGARPSVVDMPRSPGPPERSDVRPARRVSDRGTVMMAQPAHRGAPRQLAFHPGMPDAASFPHGAWARLLARRAASTKEDLFGSHSIAGYSALREAIAASLVAARGVSCLAENVIVTTGAQAALDLLARLLIDPGDSVWMEEPGYLGAQAAFASAGARLEPLHVTGESWSLTPAPRMRPRLIYVTPSCQHPLGVTMRMEQRLRLLKLAARWDAWIIEDDFDSEYGLQGQPVPAMRAFDEAERVIYVGTFAKTMFPALRLGFMVVPPSIRMGVDQAIGLTGQFAPLVLQAALCDFITSGQMARHVRRTRRLYAARRQMFMKLCREELADWITVAREQVGMQLVGHCQRRVADRDVAAAAAQRGLHVAPLSVHYRHGNADQGLVLGYASADEAAARKGVGLLRDSFQDASARNRRRPQS